MSCLQTCKCHLSFRDAYLCPCVSVARRTCASLLDEWCTCTAWKILFLPQGFNLVRIELPIESHYKRESVCVVDFNRCPSGLEDDSIEEEGGEGGGGVIVYAHARLNQWQISVQDWWRAINSLWTTPRHVPVACRLYCGFSELEPWWCAAGGGRKVCCSVYKYVCIAWTGVCTLCLYELSLLFWILHIYREGIIHFVSPVSSDTLLSQVSARIIIIV